MDLRLRPFDETRGDYEHLARLAAAVDPHSGSTAESLRYRDQTREPRVKLFRLIAEVDDAGPVGMGRAIHIWWAFHPRHFQMRIEVDPAWQRRGIGTALFDRIVAELHSWDAALVRAEAASSNPAVVDFLEHRGFTEWRRRWHSILQVADADTTALQNADARASELGITVTSYADELARRGPSLAHAVYEADTLFAQDDPTNDVDVQPMSFERFSAMQLDGPEALPQGHFLALLDGQIVGLSRLNRSLRHTDVLHQDLTGTHPAYRRRGIAQTLKLRTIQFAGAHGYREIHTSNDSANAPMVHINDAIGFKRELPTIIFERRLDRSPE